MAAKKGKKSCSIFDPSSEVQMRNDAISRAASMKASAWKTSNGMASAASLSP
jgi:hypothetical protein